MKDNIEIRVRKRLPFLWLGLLILIAIVIPNRAWNILLIGFGGLIIIAYLWALFLSKGLTATRKLRFGWMSVGDRLSEQFEIINKSAIPAIWVEVIDESNVPGYQAAVVRSISPQSTTKWKQSAVCTQRGQFKLGHWGLHSGDPFGLFRIIISYPVSDEIIIHPPIYTQLPISLPAGQGEGQVRTRQRRWRTTMNAAGIRTYQAGDPFNWIHWPKTAQYDSLLVRQFDIDAAGDIWLLLDMDAEVQIGSGPKGTEEEAIILAAALTVNSMNDNRGVGLAAYGRNPQIIPPALGQGQQWRLFRALALLQADGQSKISQAIQDLGQIAQRGSAVVVITSNNDVVWLPDLIQLVNRGVNASVILLDRLSYLTTIGNPPSTELVGQADNLRQIIRRLGIECSVIQQGNIGHIAQVLEKQGYWEFRVAGSGKVITMRNPLQNSNV